jgi:pre-mRNA 3'-end-processing factor FIP1
VDSTSKYNTIRNIPERAASSDTVTKPAAVKKETSVKATPTISGSYLPGISTSKIDIDAKPIYEPAGKPITQVNIDEGKESVRDGILGLTLARFERER